MSFNKQTYFNCLEYIPQLVERLKNDRSIDAARFEVLKKALGRWRKSLGYQKYSALKEGLNLEHYNKEFEEMQKKRVKK
jgi:hypothetical protein